MNINVLLALYLRLRVYDKNILYLPNRTTKYDLYNVITSAVTGVHNGTVCARVVQEVWNAGQKKAA